MLRNTELSYGSVAKWLHWIVALCFLGAYCTYYIPHWIIDTADPRDPGLRLAREYHVAIGLSVLVWASLRIVWKFINPEPELSPMPNWQHQSSKAMHWVLYFFMFAMPITGWMGYGGDVHYGIFQIPRFRESGLGLWILETFNVEWRVWEQPWDYFHKTISGAWVLWILIAIHAGAALYHHFVQKDNVLIGTLSF